MTDDEIRAIWGRIDVDYNPPKKVSLVSNWLLNDGGNIFHNKVTGMPNLPVVGPVSY